MELSKSDNLNAAVAFETVNLCGFDVPVFRGAQPIPQELIDKLKTPLPQDAIKENSDPKKKGMSSIKSIYITERLNEVFGLGQWLQVDKFVEKVAKPEGSGKGDSIVLKSILIVPKYGIYFEAYGGNDNYDPGDAGCAGRNCESGRSDREQLRHHARAQRPGPRKGPWATDQRHRKARLLVCSETGSEVQR